jgi:hypothetical protein
LSPQPASTKLAWIAIKSARRVLRTDGQQQSCRLWSRKPQVLGSKGPLLTNRMTELVTYGSVGGVGGNPGPYPAANAGGPRQLPRRTRWAARVALSFGGKRARFGRGTF